MKPMQYKAIPHYPLSPPLVHRTYKQEQYSCIAPPVGEGEMWRMIVQEPAGYMTGMADFRADTIPACLIKTDQSDTLITCRTVVASGKWCICL